MGGGGWLKVSLVFCFGPKLKFFLLGCAQAYFDYWKALLEMARLEAGVLGNGLDGGAFYSL